MKHTRLAVLCIAALLSARPVFAAVAFESHTGSAKVTSASTTGPTFSLTCDGTAGEKAFVAFGQQSATTTATIGGNAMTEVPSDSPQINSGYELHLFYRDSPGSGSLTVASTWSSAIVGSAVGACYSGTGTGLDSHVGNNNGGGAGAGEVTTTTTVVASNSWLVSAAVTSTGPTDISAGTGTTSRVSITDANTIVVALGDSNGTVGTGSQSMGWTPTGTSLTAVILVSIAPPGAGGGCTGGLLLLGAGKC
jgi:hypothetical protein